MTRPLIGIGSILGTLLVIVFLFVAFENIEANEIVVHQDFTSGKLTTWRKPGLNYKGFGRITTWPKSDEFRFLADKDAKGNITSTKDCIQTVFNDKGRAWICGQVSFDLPVDDVSMGEIHEKYGTIESAKDRIVKATMVKAIGNSGPLMSSQESAGQRRGDLITFMQDQATQGIYKTTEKEDVIEDLTSPPIEVVEMADIPLLDKDGKVQLNDKGDPILVKEGRKKLVPQKKVVKVLLPMEKDGILEVREVSVSKALGIRIHSFTIDTIVYEDKVQDQINAQRDMEMKIQTKIAEANSAKQEAITAEQSGMASAAKAKWEQEVEKARAVTKAQQAREVATQDLETARLERDAQVTRAEGESRAKKLVMDADGALEKKLAAYVEVNRIHADAISKQRWVPEIQMGGGDGKPGAATDLLQMIAIKAAQDLALDTRPTGK